MIVIKNNMDDLPIMNLFFIFAEALFLGLLFFGCLSCLIWEDIQRGINIGFLLVIDGEHDTIVSFHDLLLEVIERAAILSEGLEEVSGALCVSLLLVLVFLRLIVCFDRLQPLLARIHDCSVALIVGWWKCSFRCILVEVIILDSIFK